MKKSSDSENKVAPKKAKTPQQQTASLNGADDMVYHGQQRYDESCECAPKTVPHGYDDERSAATSNGQGQRFPDRSDKNNGLTKDDREDEEKNRFKAQGKNYRRDDEKTIKKDALDRTAALKGMQEADEHFSAPATQRITPDANRDQK